MRMIDKFQGNVVKSETSNCVSIFVQAERNLFFSDQWQRRKRLFLVAIMKQKSSALTVTTFSAKVKPK
jgi:hypothetical protein